jgi:hypothetical protein
MSWGATPGDSGYNPGLKGSIGLDFLSCRPRTSTYPSLDSFPPDDAERIAQVGERRLQFAEARYARRQDQGRAGPRLFGSVAIGRRPIAPS